MLVLSRKPGEKIVVGDVVFHVLEPRSGKTRIGIEAPPGVKILREELVGAAPSTPCLVEIGSTTEA